MATWTSLAPSCTPFAFISRKLCLALQIKNDYAGSKTIPRPGGLTAIPTGALSSAVPPVPSNVAGKGLSILITRVATRRYSKRWLNSIKGRLYAHAGAELTRTEMWADPMHGRPSHCNVQWNRRSDYKSYLRWRGLGSL